MSTIQPVQSGLALRVTEGSTNESHHLLTRSVISIGRATPETPYTSSYLTFPEPTVSRLHAVLTWEPGAAAFMLHHRSQTNPTLLNGKNLTRSTLLKPGDVVALGRLVLILEKSTAEQSESGHWPEMPEQSQTQSQTLVLNIRTRSSNNDRIFSVPIEKAQLLLNFSPDRTTAAIAAEQPGDLTQQVTLSGASSSSLGFLFQSIEEVTVETTTPDSPEAYRKTLLHAGTLTLPLKLGTPVSLTQHDTILHQGHEIWLAIDSSQSPVDSTLEKEPPTAAAVAEQSALDAQLTFLNGAWKGATFDLPAKGSSHFDLGPDSKSFHHPLPLQNSPTCSITFLDGEARLRVIQLSDDQFLDINGELLFTGESTKLFSGSTILLGEFELFWSVPSQHEHYTQYQVVTNESGHSIDKAEVRIGTAAHCEIQLRGKGLAPVVGSLRYEADGFIYKHLNIACTAIVDNKELTAGLEVQVTVDSVLELAPGVAVKLAKKA